MDAQRLVQWIRGQGVVDCRVTEQGVRVALPGALAERLGSGEEARPFSALRYVDGFCSARRLFGE